MTSPLHVFCCTVLLAAARGLRLDMRFVPVAALSDLLFANNLLFEQHDVRSKLQCASGCVKTAGCWTFTFHRSGLCQGRNTATFGLNESRPLLGARTYQTGNWLDKPCLADSDCQTNVFNVQCFERRCLCTPGYFYSISTRACNRQCSQDNRQLTFVMYPGWRIYLSNLAFHLKLSLDACKTQCITSYPTCNSFEYLNNTGECNPGAVTALDVPNLWQRFTDYNYLAEGYHDFYQTMCV